MQNEPLDHTPTDKYLEDASSNSSQPELNQMENQPQIEPLEMASSQVETPAQPIKKQENWLLFGVKLLVLAAAVFLFTQLVTPPYIVNGMSMEPNFHTDERLITDRAIFKMFGHPQRDDVVILNKPGDGEVLIKRVIGLPGDTVRVDNDTVYINGKALNEPFIQYKTDYNFGPETVPPDDYFVMGDNRSHSLDSHLFGFVPNGNIIARVWFKLF